MGSIPTISTKKGIQEFLPYLLDKVGDVFLSAFLCGDVKVSTGSVTASLFMPGAVAHETRHGTNKCRCFGTADGCLISRHEGGHRLIKEPVAKFMFRPEADRMVAPRRWPRAHRGRKGGSMPWRIGK